MFTGIIETVGVITAIEIDGSNRNFYIESELTPELKIDQSVAHNGVCLTVVGIYDKQYQVTAIQETLDKTVLADYKIGNKVNLERCMLMNGRLDGHIVQGHVDTIATCTHISEIDGSWHFGFKVSDPTTTYAKLIVSKGSITINGTSLTVVNPVYDYTTKCMTFEVAIIPYTYENTIFHTLRINQNANIEFDIIGKYVVNGLLYS